jgi:hypothetical protein
MNLDNLNLQMDDDLSLDPGDYADPLPFAPPPDGTYTLRLLDVDLDVDQNGEVKGQKDGEKFYPTVIIKSVEIADGELAGRKVFPFARVYTKPFMRKTAAGEKPASSIADMVRAFDAQANFRGVKEALTLLKQYQEQGTPFKARLRWEAYDSQHAKALQAQGLDRKACSKACSIKGMKHFAPDGKGGYLPEVIGPSGETLEARLGIAQFITAEA